MLSLEFLMRKGIERKLDFRVQVNANDSINLRGDRIALL
jgi:hypothetical protein